jgi:hypothetical protein
MRESRLPSERESRIEWWRRLIFRQQSTLVALSQFCQQMGIRGTQTPTDPGQGPRGNPRQPLFAPPTYRRSHERPSRERRTTPAS